METLHIILMYLQVKLTYHIGGVVPAWFVIAVLLAGIVNAAIKKSNNTTAEKWLELGARAVLKIPAVGVWIAAIPLLGSALHLLANDDANVPPTLAMRIAGKVPPKAPIPASSVPMVPGDTIATIVTPAVVITPVTEEKP